MDGNLKKIRQLGFKPVKWDELEYVANHRHGHLSRCVDRSNEKRYVYATHHYTEDCLPYAGALIHDGYDLIVIEHDERNRCLLWEDMLGVIEGKPRDRLWYIKNGEEYDPIIDC